METHNVFLPPIGAPKQEVFEQLLKTDGFELERIYTTGQSTPEGDWYDQEHAEWVMLLSGAARLEFDAPRRLVALRPGDYLCIPARCRHRVQWTDPDQATVWLALHFRER